MAQARRRPPKATRSARGTARGARPAWLWLALLALGGVAIVAARTLDLPGGNAPQAAEPTLSTGPAPTRSVAAERAPVVAVSGPTLRSSTPPIAAAPTAIRSARTTPAPTRASTASAAVTVSATSRPSTASPTTTPNATARHASGVATAPVPTRPLVATEAPASAAARPAAATDVPASAAARPAAATDVPVKAAAGQVELTFDAGSDRGYAEDILDLLQQEHISASFGVTGQWAKANPDLVRRMAADGHMIINHTLDHRSFTGVSDQLGGLSPTRRRAELDEADTIIAALIGHSTRPWYRLPYGDDDARVAADVASDGYTHKVGWTVDSLGWKGLQSTDIVARCLKLAAPEGVYIFHVGRASQDAIALPQVIDGLREKGFSFARVDGA